MQTDKRCMVSPASLITVSETSHSIDGKIPWSTVSLPWNENCTNAVHYCHATSLDAAGNMFLTHRRIENQWFDTVLSSSRAQTSRALFEAITIFATNTVCSECCYFGSLATCWFSISSDPSPSVVALLEDIHQSFKLQPDFGTALHQHEPSSSSSRKPLRVIRAATGKK